VTEAARRVAADGRRPLVSLVATALRRLDPDLFDTVLLGGAAPPGSLPPNTVVTYGMTETGSGVVYDGVPLDGVEVRVVDGQVHLRGPMLLRCYRDGTDPKDDAGWLATGDGGRLLPDGRLEVDGRLADVVVTGGEKVWPAAVERVLGSVDGVGEVAVGGLPDPEWGQRVVAYVVADPAAAPSLDRLRAAVKEQLGPWAAPRQLVLVDRLPRTASGKVARHALAALAASPAPSADG
jgi:O-succinylbenzoic acid--CoA ligase